MHIQCRLMEVSDYGAVECVHWESAAQVARYIDRQGIASMLAYEGERYLGQLYVQEYDPAFSDPGGHEGHRPWADFRVAEPLELEGRYLTIGCYHVGWLADGTRDSSLYGRGIGTALVTSLIDWFHRDSALDGLLTWALSPASRRLLQIAGQMPRTVYARLGFDEVKRVRDPRWNPLAEEWADAGAADDLADLRVFVLRREATR